MKLISQHLSGKIRRSSEQSPYIPKGMMFAVLRLIPRLGPEASGAVIREVLSQQLDTDVPAAKIYVSLGRLEDRNLVMSEHEPEAVAEVRKTRRRLIYRLTSDGQKALELGLKLYSSTASKAVDYDFTLSWKVQELG
ncbi:MAG: helix-turn-helix transcriptional regulator [Rhodomicrobium sp.]